MVSFARVDMCHISRGSDSGSIGHNWFGVEPQVPDEVLEGLCGNIVRGSSRPGFRSSPD